MGRSVTLCNRSSNGTDTPNGYQIPETKTYGVIQTSFLSTSGGSVAIQGRLTTAHDWITITTHTADDSDVITLFPHMQAVLSGYSGSGNVLTTLDV